MRTLYYREKQHFANVPFLVCRAASLVYIQHRPGQCYFHDAALILWYCVLYVMQGSRQRLYVVNFTRCLYSLRILFDFSVLIYSIIAYLMYIYAVLGLFLYVYTINIQFLYSFVWKNRTT